MRGARVAAAAEDAWLAGRPDWAIELAGRAEVLVSDPKLRAELVHLRGTIELRCGVPAEALRILAAGASEIAPVAPEKAIEMLIEAAQSASYAGDAAQIVEMGRRASALLKDDQPDTRFAVDVIVGIGRLLSATRGWCPAAEGSSGRRGFHDPRRLVHAGACAGYLGDDATEHELYGRAVERAREIGAVGTLPYVLEYLARAEAVAGRYAAATAHATEGLRLGEETGQQNSICTLYASLALIAALQGARRSCRDCGRALGPRRARGLGYQAALADWALARLELSLGDPERGAVRLVEVAAAVPGASHPFVRLVATADLVEAAVRASHPATAQPALGEFERFARERRRRGGSPASLAAADYSRPGRGRAPFREALRRHGERARPFDRARTELIFGEFLRRAGGVSRRVGTCARPSTSSSGSARSRGQPRASSCAQAARPPPARAQHGRSAHAAGAADRALRRRRGRRTNRSPRSSS